MTAFLGFVLAIFTGPVCPEGVLFHACDPNERMELLLHTSDDLPTVREGWRRFWMSDQPSHLTYHRVHGGVDADLPVLFGACRVPKWTREEYLLQLPGVWRHFWRNDPSNLTPSWMFGPPRRAVYGAGHMGGPSIGWMTANLLSGDTCAPTAAYIPEGLQAKIPVTHMVRI
jgi:hypothetical protein